MEEKEDVNRIYLKSVNGVKSTKGLITYKNKNSRYRKKDRCIHC